jgi:tetratricopeptide (TPR) repeat protein
MFRQALEIDPMSIDALEGLEHLYHSAGDLEGEMAILQHELQLWPDHADYVYSKMEETLRNSGDWAELAKTLEKHIGAVPDPARRTALRCDLGEAFEQLADGARAREAFAQALLEQPNEPRALDGLARVSA